MRPSFVLLSGLLLSLLVAPCRAAPDLARTIEERNPEIRAFDARLSALESRVGPAGTWRDPRLTAEAMDLASGGGPRLGVTQMIPLLGQPGLMARMATLEVEMTRAEREERLRMLVAEARQAEFEEAYVRRVERILERSRDLTARMSRVAEAKYAVGKGMQPDVLRAHVARTKLWEPSIGLVSRRSSARATLEAIAPGYLPADQPDLAPSALAPPALPDLQDLTRRAEASSPMLRMRRLAVSHAELGEQLARRERLPDLELGVAVGRTMPGDMPYLSGMASVELPVWFARKQERRLEEAERRLEAESQRLEAARRDLHARLATRHAEARAAGETLALYRGGLQKQAELAFKAALAAYQVDQGDFLMVLESQMALYEIEMAEAMALTERLKMIAMLEALVGAPLTKGTHP